jgi:ribosome-associated translation inhibitor RaiA
VQLASPEVMRITVSSVNAPTADNHAYAEYRFFTSIAQYEGQVRSVAVVVRRDPAVNRRFLCTVVIDLGPSGRVKTQARATYPNAAIDRAADRIAWLVSHRVGTDFSLKSAGSSS